MAGLRRRSIAGFLLAFVGSWLVRRALKSTRPAQTAQSPTITESSEDDTSETTVRRTITIGESAEELYEMWRDPETFSEIMGHFADVSSDGDEYEWTVHGPGGRDISWETRIVEESPGEFLRWESLGDPTVPNEGWVRFTEASGERGTTVILNITFDPPGGVLGNRVLQWLGVAPETLAGEALGRFKSLVESGEVQTLEGNPSARGRGDLL